MWVGVPMIFPPQLAGKSCCISYKAEIIEVAVGKKDKPLARTVVSEGERECLGRLITRTNLERCGEGGDSLWSWTEWLVLGWRKCV